MRSKPTPPRRGPCMYRDAYGNAWDGHGDKPDWLARAIYAGTEHRSLPLLRAVAKSVTTAAIH